MQLTRWHDVFVALRVSTNIQRPEPQSCPFVVQGGPRMQIVRPEHRPGSAGHEYGSTAPECASTDHQGSRAIRPSAADI
jgi:hypothetical protein